MPAWALVTPASRGIGLHLARHLLRTTTLPIVATARKDVDQAREHILRPVNADDLVRGPGRTVSEDTARVLAREGDASRLHVLNLDVTSDESMAAAAARCADLFPSKPRDGGVASHLRLAFAVPGILHPEKAPSQMEHSRVSETFAINAVGPLLLLKHFSAFLPRKATAMGDEDGPVPSHATWAAMSARVGSISDNALGGWYSYRASKAAVNQMVKSFDNYLRTSAGERALAVALHPGTVRTGLSEEFWNNVKEEKLFAPEFAAERLIDVVARMGLEQRGKCWDWRGEEVPP